MYVNVRNNGGSQMTASQRMVHISNNKSPIGDSVAGGLTASGGIIPQNSGFKCVNFFPLSTGRGPLVSEFTTPSKYIVSCNPYKTKT